MAWMYRVSRPSCVDRVERLQVTAFANTVTMPTSSPSLVEDDARQIIRRGTKEYVEKAFVVCRSVYEAPPVTEGRGHSDGQRRSSFTKTKTLGYRRRTRYVWLRFDCSSEGTTML